MHAVIRRHIWAIGGVGLMVAGSILEDNLGVPLGSWLMLAGLLATLFWAATNWG